MGPLDHRESAGISGLNFRGSISFRQVATLRSGGRPADDRPGSSGIGLGDD
jgi:hypothetical protein